MNNNVVWEFPVPSSEFGSPFVDVRPKREIAVCFDFESEEDETCKVELIFTNVIHYRVTFLHAIAAKIFRECYDKVVDLKNSSELNEILPIAVHHTHSGDFHHYRVCFDGGPAFDFIAASFLAKVT